MTEYSLFLWLIRMTVHTIDIIIPVYKPGKEFLQLLNGLKKQTVQADRIIVMHTRSGRDDLKKTAEKYGFELYELDAADFDHGGTRAEAAEKSEADILIFMTQDAIPADENLIERLIAPFANDRVGVTYARQLPREDCRIIEKYTRSFNYPDRDRAKSLDDLPKLGIKTYFCSDVCAAYRRDVYEELEGFVHPVIFNEDMIMASKIIKSGRVVYYAADARVIHSHNYSWREQFHRNFDLAVSQADHPEVFAGISSESEGKKMVVSTMKYLCRSGKPWLVFSLVCSSGAKYLGYFFGKRYRKLPGSIVRKFTSNQSYWINK